MHLGEKIAALRTAMGMTQQELADRLFVSRDLVSKWEGGKRRPDYGTVERLAEILGADTEDLLPKDAQLFAELAECLPEGTETGEDELPALLGSFLAGCSSRDRQLFMQRYYHLRSYGELAHDWGMKENHIRSILSKTRKKLRKYLTEDGDERKSGI